MFLVKYIISGNEEDISEEATFDAAMKTATSWVEDAHEDIDGIRSMRESVDVVIEEVKTVLWAQFPIWTNPMDL
jgi:hypothetical protein